MRRALILGALLLAELFSFHAPYDLADRPLAARAAEDYSRSIIWILTGLLCGAVCFAMAAWHRRTEITARWKQSAASHRWAGWAALSAAAMLALFAATLAIKLSDQSRLAPIWLLVVPWSAGVALVVGTWCAAFAPLSYWRSLAGSLLREYRLEAAIGAGGVLLAWGSSLLARNSWDLLAGATFAVSRWILGLYEPQVYVDAQERILGVGNYYGLVSPECSGYEGIGLITAFLLVYLAVFRRELKFPNALLLFPIGALVIWLLNGARIAMLVTIGGHLSPELASHGFHSTAGWLMFLAVTIAILFGTHRIAFFRAGNFRAASPAEPAVRLAMALLVPFAALMAGRVVSSIFISAGHWVYAVGVVFVVIALWLFRDVYARLASRASWLSMASGALIGLAWVATDPARGTAGEIDAWVASLTPQGAALWLGLRVFGFVLLVPIAEELAFRGYLLRAMSGRRFESVGARQFTWLALLVSTGLFAAMHSRWLAAFIAGAVYAYLYYRSGRLADPIVSHAVSNGTIAGVALLTRQWSLL